MIGQHGFFGWWMSQGCLLFTHDANRIGFLSPLRIHLKILPSWITTWMYQWTASWLHIFFLANLDLKIFVRSVKHSWTPNSDRTQDPAEPRSKVATSSSYAPQTCWIPFQETSLLVLCSRRILIQEDGQLIKYCIFKHQTPDRRFPGQYGSTLETMVFFPT